MVDFTVYSIVLIVLLVLTKDYFSKGIISGLLILFMNVPIDRVTTVLGFGAMVTMLVLVTYELTTIKK